jgi:hypothetical protein
MAKGKKGLHLICVNKIIIVPGKEQRKTYIKLSGKIVCNSFYSLLIFCGHKTHINCLVFRNLSEKLPVEWLVNL